MEAYHIPGFTCHFVTCGRGKGIVTYFPDKYQVENYINNPMYQITKITSEKMDILNVYRSSNAGDTFIKDLQDLLTDSIEKTTILCGDFNFCIKKHPRHPIKEFLGKKGFVQSVQQSTHIDGGVLDHVYILCKEPMEIRNVETKLKGCYYSDHDKNITIFKN